MTRAILNLRAPQSSMFRKLRIKVQQKKTRKTRLTKRTRSVSQKRCQKHIGKQIRSIISLQDNRFSHRSEELSLGRLSRAQIAHSIETIVELAMNAPQFPQESFITSHHAHSIKTTAQLALNAPQSPQESFLTSRSPQALKASRCRELKRSKVSQ